jgi:hypothetical protein
MPRDYADTDPQHAELARAGKTTFQVPVGPQTLFSKKEGMRVSDIVDGAGLTMAVVEVVPERAVEWTKPADWEVDWQNPLEGVRRTDRPSFAAGFCDAHGAMIINDIDPANFRTLLTPAAKDVINR